MLCEIWYHSQNFKNVKNTHGIVLFFVKFQASACNFTKSNATPWVFFTFSNLYKWYQNRAKRLIGLWTWANQVNTSNCILVKVYLRGVIK